MDLIETHRQELDRLCQLHHVQRLELFGSATSRLEFDHGSSDLDFIVEFAPLEPGRRFDTYFDLLESLEQLFDRKVDLVVERAIRNRFFRESVNRTRKLLYAA